MPSAATIDDHRHRIKRVMLHVDRHLDRRCRLEDLAGVACFSPFYFNRVFASVMGEAPHQGSYEFLMQTWNAIYLDWLPRSGNGLRDAPPFEIYLNTDSPEDPLQKSAWILIPIH